MSEAVYDLNAFSLSDVVRCGTQLRRIAAGAADFDDACRQVVGHLHAQVVDGATGEPGFVLVQLIQLDSAAAPGWSPRWATSSTGRSIHPAPPGRDSEPSCAAGSPGRTGRSTSARPPTAS